MSSTDSGSRSGFHYANLIQCCARKFYLRYVCKLKSPHVHPALILGQAVHEGKRVFYSGGSAFDVVNSALDVVERNASLFEEPKHFEKTVTRAPAMLRLWIETFGKIDLQQYKIVAVEEELTIPLNYLGHVATLRPDLIVEDKVSGDIYIFDTKTASFSIRLAQDTVEHGDQATMYLYGVARVFETQIQGFVPDILYWNSNTDNIQNLQAIRPIIVARTEVEQANFIKGFSQTMLDISSRVEAVAKGEQDEWAVFPRNPHYCTSFNRVCEYASICRATIKPEDSVRSFIKEQEHALTTEIDDSIAVQ